MAVTLPKSSEKDQGHAEVQRHKDCAQTLLERYDLNRSGRLDRNEVRSLLVSMGPHEDVTEDELDFVFKIAAPRGDTAIHLCQMCPLLNCWENYKSSSVEINEHFEKHDPDGTGRLDKDQLKGLLEDLAKQAKVNHDVTLADVNWILKQSDVLKNGVITKPELRRVLALWTNHLQNAGAGCCTVQ